MTRGRALFFQLFRGFGEAVAAGGGPVGGGAWGAYKEVRRAIKPGRRLAAKIQLFRGLRSLDMGVAIDNNPRSAATPFLEVFFRSSARKRAKADAPAGNRFSNPLTKLEILSGGVPEWLKGTDCKSVGYAYVGSNPTPSTIHRPKGMSNGDSEPVTRD